MNCKKYIKKAQFQKMTWLKLLPSYIKYYHVIGDPDLKTECGFMFDENQWQYIFQQYSNNKLSNSYIVNLRFESLGILTAIESSGQIFAK